MSAFDKEPCPLCKRELDYVPDVELAKYFGDLALKLVNPFSLAKSFIGIFRHCYHELNPNYETYGSERYCTNCKHYFVCCSCGHYVSTGRSLPGFGDSFKCHNCGQMLYEYVEVRGGRC